MNAFSGMSIETFTKELASNAPVPGGGGAAALCGALGASLSMMSAHFTLPKKAYADVKEDIEQVLLALEKARAKLIDMIEDDAKAFEPLSKAYKLPKDDPATKDALEEATMQALLVPLEMLRLLAETAPLIEQMKRIGAKMLLSDVGCSATMCGAAAEAAAINIYVNTKSLKDRKKADEINRETDALVKRTVTLCREITEEVTDKMKGII